MTNKELREYLTKQMDFSLRLRGNAIEGNMDLPVAFHNGYLTAIADVLQKLES